MDEIVLLASNEQGFITAPEKPKGQPSIPTSTPIPIEQTKTADKPVKGEKCGICGKVGGDVHLQLCKACCMQGNHYQLTAIPKEPTRWSGTMPVPPIGSLVEINFNKLGTGRVTGYWVEYGWLGVQVKLHNDPVWHVTQQADLLKQGVIKPWSIGHALVVGAEIKVLSTEPPKVTQGSFGLPMEDVTTYWGARAIYQPSAKTSFMPIDILHDRQSCIGDESAKGALVSWLNTIGLPWLRANCKLCPDSRDYVQYKDNRFIIRATPNASYGYLYIGAGIVSN
jgi:hypothetical protein